jgi:hypothetical protein
MSGVWKALAVTATALSLSALLVFIFGVYIAISTGDGTAGGIGGFSLVPFVLFGVTAGLLWAAYLDSSEEVRKHRRQLETEAAKQKIERQYSTVSRIISRERGGN